jgi:hypothetical protein
MGGCGLVSSGEDGDYFRAAVNTAMNLDLPVADEKFLTNLTAVILSRMTHSMESVSLVFVSGNPSRIFY